MRQHRYCTTLPTGFSENAKLPHKKKTEFMTSYSAIGAARYSSQKVLT